MLNRRDAGDVGTVRMIFHSPMNYPLTFYVDTLPKTFGGMAHGDLPVTK